MFLFNFIGPEMIVILFAIVIPGLVIWLIIKAIRGVSCKKKSNTSSSSGSGDKIAKLERLANLKQKGMLTDEEFQKEKRKLL